MKRIISAFVTLVAAAFLFVHLFFFWSVGTFDPCKAAVLRIIQKQRDGGQDLAAGVGMLFGRQLEDALRTEGILVCYRSALKGQAPELELQILDR